jgi:hypothetical protein
MDRNQNYQPDSVLADSTRDVISNGSLPAQKRPLSAVDEDEDEGIEVRPHQRLRESVGDNYNREQESRVCKQALANDTANSNPVRGHANGPVPPQNNTATAMAPVVINFSPTASLEPRPIQASQLRRDRKLLALMLLKSFRPDAPLPESVVAILDFIRCSGLADSTWPRENSGCSLGSNKGVLERWQAFAGILQAFRDRTGFEGSQEAWNVRCTSLRGGPRLDASEQLLEASVKMEDWLLKLQKEGLNVSAFSNKVANVLLNLAEWMNTMNDENIAMFREKIKTLNERLEGWFIHG